LTSALETFLLLFEQDDGPLKGGELNRASTEERRSVSNFKHRAAPFRGGTPCGVNDPAEVIECVDKAVTAPWAC